MSDLYIQKWQKTLAEDKLYAGRIDGDFGPMTFDASLRAYRNPAATEPDKRPMEDPLPTETTTAHEVPTYAPAIVPAKRFVNHIIWHCAATPEGKDFTVNDIRAWHRARGWNDVGYHYLVYRDGSVVLGRDIDTTGAHVSGHNTGSLGCCFIGGMDAAMKKAKDTRTPEQKSSMIWLTKELIRANPKINRVSGHNEWSAKACPSFKVPSDPLGNLPGFNQGRRI